MVYELTINANNRIKCLIVLFFLILSSRCNLHKKGWFVLLKKFYFNKRFRRNMIEFGMKKNKN
ncbi:hypothetical protein HMPREF2660_07710 [Weeksella sp. HMSC059D05]|nr:hypothetical protein HMPREF2660_07710 [Weeksella sp. HMSC059D05]